PRWRGQQGRRDDRWRDRGVHPAAVHRDRRLQVPDLRHRARADHDLPLAGPVPGAAEAPGLRPSCVPTSRPGGEGRRAMSDGPTPNDPTPQAPEEEPVLGANEEELEAAGVDLEVA